MCSPKYADVREDDHCGNAKRLECVQLAGAIVARGRAESGSKLHALQTLRAGDGHGGGIARVDLWGLRIRAEAA